MRVSDDDKYVPVLFSADINAGVDCDSVNMKNVRHAAFHVMFGPSLAGDAVLTLYSGATDGAKTTAMTFNYRYGGAAIKSASADVYSASASSAALTATGTTYVSRHLIIEVDAANMTDGHSWLTLNINADASAGECAVLAELEPTYASPAGNSFLV